MPCPRASVSTAYLPSATGIRRTLSCPVMGTLAVTQSEGMVMPAAPVFTPPCPCEADPVDRAFSKAPNPAVKQAQDLMNEAENKYANRCAAGCCPPRTIPSVDPATLVMPNNDAEAVAILKSLVDATFKQAIVVNLPDDLPASVEVAPQAFKVSRGEAFVVVFHTDDRVYGETGWRIGQIQHEASVGDEYMNPLKPVSKIRNTGFATPAAAIEAAYALLNALDAWYETQQTAKAKVAEALGNFAD